MTMRVIFLILLLFILAACSIAKVIVIKADPVGTPIIIPQLIIIEPMEVPPFIPEFGATALPTITPDYPFPTSQPTVGQTLPFGTFTPQPDITPSNLPPIGGS